MKVLRTDNGGEFYMNEFEEFYNKCGILRKNTIPCTHQYIRVSKWMCKALMEKARSMLNSVCLSQESWVEVVDNVYYLVNRSPISVLVDKNPHEVCTDKMTLS